MIGRRARRYRGDLSSFQRHFRKTAFHCRSARRGAEWGGGKEGKKGGRSGEGGGRRRERGVREKDGEKKSSDVHNRGQCGPYTYTPSLSAGKKLFVN